MASGEEDRRIRDFIMANGVVSEQFSTGGMAVARQNAPALDRLDSVDRLRGLVMALMALDHVRGYFTTGPDPTDLQHTTAALLLTRWISHLCAPTFIFLAGTSAYLAAQRGKTKGALAWFLFTRGLWLVLLELTLIKFFWGFTLDANFNAGVLWAIGWSMVVLAGLIFLPTWAVTAFGALLIAGHNLFDSMRPADLGPLSDFWEILHRKEMHRAEPLAYFGGAIKFDTQYPLIPWIGVMAAGYGLGALLSWPAAVRRKWLLGLGTALCLGFVLLRASNVYGDPDPWSDQGDRTFTILSFLNCHKYPLSLLYLLMTLGPALLLLAWFEEAPRMPGRPLVVFGRVPMFFYLIHIPLIHALAKGQALVRYGPGVFAAEQMPTDYGYSLPAVYTIWFGILLALYPVCRWFAGVKRRSRAAWLTYL
jgi:uncharacterized membrane protein